MILKNHASPIECVFTLVPTLWNTNLHVNKVQYLVLHECQSDGKHVLTNVSDYQTKVVVMNMKYNCVYYCIKLIIIVTNRCELIRPSTAANLSVRYLLYKVVQSSVLENPWLRIF